MSHANPEGSDARSSASPFDHTIGELLARLSQETSRLVRDEIRLAQAELSETGKRAGIGLGLFSVGGVLAWFGLGALVAAAILALQLVMPAWLAAAIVAVVLFIAAGIAALTGKKQVQQMSPKPERTVDTVKADIEAVKEARHRDHTR
ncbi:phage holin family protein [uncultured Aeromicrobium sp.]|uniref:phage holin family protein n=1 Tax=uncultured Aeromicrobium sp. TaxID=337820 RepID=UPI0025F7BA5E|nr:phage holin family protein [uncultured Aeromicrobium sp.]